jgi:hypothetical protein
MRLHDILLPPATAAWWLRGCCRVRVLLLLSLCTHPHFAHALG